MSHALESSCGEESGAVRTLVTETRHSVRCSPAGKRKASPQDRQKTLAHPANVGLRIPRRNPEKIGIFWAASLWHATHSGQQQWYCQHWSTPSPGSQGAGESDGSLHAVHEGFQPLRPGLPCAHGGCIWGTSSWQVMLMPFPARVSKKSCLCCLLPLHTAHQERAVGRPIMA